MTSAEARPFLKWAGGKQQLLAQFAPLLPAAFRRYHEPFLGSGALYFHLWNTGRITTPASLTDNNAELIGAYALVRADVEGLINRLQEHAARHGREHYYAVRALDRGAQPLAPVEQAARMIYLNRTCYNGLYRVNRQGYFNTPPGSYTAPRIVQPRRWGRPARRWRMRRWRMLRCAWQRSTLCSNGRSRAISSISTRPMTR